MTALIPVPGNIAKMLQSTQREAMKKVNWYPNSCGDHSLSTLQTDARVQSITESMFTPWLALTGVLYTLHVPLSSLERSPDGQALWMGV